MADPASHRHHDEVSVGQAEYDHSGYQEVHDPQHGEVAHQESMNEVYESAPWLFSMLRKRFNQDGGQVSPDSGAPQSLGSPLLLQSNSTVDVHEGAAVTAGGRGIDEINDGTHPLHDDHEPASSSSFAMFLPKKNRPSAVPPVLNWGPGDYSNTGSRGSDWNRLHEEDEILPGSLATPFPFGGTAGARDAGNSQGPDMDRLAARVLEMLNQEPGMSKKTRPGYGDDDDIDNFSKGGVSFAMGKNAKYDKLGDEEEDVGLMKPPWDISEYNGDTVYPFNAGQDNEQGGFDDEEGLIPPHFRKIIKVRWLGLATFVAFILAFIFYVWWRSEYTLNLGSALWYGILVLVAECIGALAIIPYGMTLILYVVNDTPWSDMDGKLLPETTLRYHLRVMIPCYKEPVDVISKTVLAALHAPLPEGCQKTIYLCDDGKDPEKKKFCHSLNRGNVVYVSGRERKKGEMNGKSCNINNCARLLYPAGLEVPLSEVITIFDADQVANPDFFIKIVPLMDGGADVGMVLSPQTFYNLNPEGDIFNHGNTHFWHYIQPGYDAWGVISCTGTNFIMRSRAFMQVGGFPDDTLTEDFALGIEFKRYNWQCRYVCEYLAIGECPEAVRNCFQQRSRWSKGHFQLFFSRKCPLFRSRLNVWMRIFYGGVVVAYFSDFIVTPLLVLVPMITIWFGTFPIIINKYAATCVTVYFTVSSLMMYFVYNLGHLKALWFSQLANAILWFAFLKAFVRTTVGKLISGNIVFKATIKGLQKMVDSAFRDVWIAALIVIGCVASLVVGIIHLTQGPIHSPLLISLLWSVFNLVPQTLLLWYAFFPHGGHWRRMFNWMCKLGMLVQWLSAMAAVILIWPMLPKTYEFQQPLQDTFYFYDTQMSGILPVDLGVNWRGDAQLQDAMASTCDVGIAFNRNFTRDYYLGVSMQVGPGFANLTQCMYMADLLGGYYTNAGLGNIKMTLPIAWTTAVLSWGLITFRENYDKAGVTDQAKQAIRWGADYLKKAYVNNTQDGASTIFLVTRVGNITYERDYWGRPEREDYMRPAYAVTMQEGATDLAGQVAAGLAAASLALSDSDPLYAQGLVAEARRAWSFANYTRNRWTDWDIQARLYYQSNSFWDDLAWGAAWLYRATKDPVYLANYFFAEILHINKEGDEDAEYMFDTDKLFWGTNLLMAQISDASDPTFKNQTATMLQKWVCPGNKAEYTIYGRAYNPNFTSLHETANVVMMSVMYADLIREENPAAAQVYECWSLSQIRYILGDSKKSFLVGYGHKPPKRTQDRAASCPNPPEPCNVLTSLYSSKEDTHVLKGALIQGPGATDSFEDVRSSNSANVGIEMTAGLTAALGGAMNFPEGLWQICLQTYGVIRWNPVCGYSSILK